MSWAASWPRWFCMACCSLSCICRSSRSFAASRSFIPSSVSFFPPPCILIVLAPKTHQKPKQVSARMTASIKMRMPGNAAPIPSANGMSEPYNKPGAWKDAATRPKTLASKQSHNNNNNNNNNNNKMPRPPNIPLLAAASLSNRISGMSDALTGRYLDGRDGVGT